MSFSASNNFYTCTTTYERVQLCRRVYSKDLGAQLWTIFGDEL